MLRAGCGGLVAVVISGIGTCRPVPGTMAAESMAVEAVERACADAGVDPKDVDGLIKLSYDGSISTMAMARELNARESRLSVEVPLGGGSTGSVLEIARMAVGSGLAKTVVGFRSVSGVQFKHQVSSPDQHRQYYLDTVNYLRPAGWTSYFHMFAAMFDEYSRRYGTTKETLGRVVIALRENAIAAGNRPVSDRVDLSTYMAAPAQIGPLGDYDDYTVSDVATAFVVTSHDRVGDRSRPVAEILATAQSHGPDPRGWHDTTVLSPAAFGGPVRTVAERLFEKTGLTPADVNVAGMYDCTAFTFLFMMEQSMLCKPGSFAELAADAGAFGPGGAVPANLDGGDLAAGYTHGFRHITEAVQQLRGISVNQVANAEIAMVMGGPASVTSGALLRRKEL